ncbi:MAG: FtsQ-type POTRA domain-containing protein [Patescibacteria group bacterium]
MKLFKRKNKTLTPGFRSYKTAFRRSGRKPIMSKRPIQATKSSSERRRLPSFKLALFFKVGAASLITGALSYTLFFSPLLKVEKVEVKGSSETAAEEAALSSYLQNYLGANLLLFPTGQHEDKLLEDFPYLKTLEIHRQVPGTLLLKVEPQTHVANVQMEENVFVVNEGGIVASAGALEEGLPLLFMESVDSEETPEIGKNLIEAEVLAVLLETASDFEAKFNMQVNEIHYLKRARELHLLTERNFSVWLDLTQNMEEQLSKLKKSMGGLNIYEANLEYIDLRISGQNGEKIIYKLYE